MLIIRDAQIQAMGEARLARFTATLCAKVRHEFPAQCEGESAAATLARVGRGVAMAARLGVETEGGIEVLVKVLVALGDDLDGARPEEGWVRAILVDPQWETEEERLRALVEAVVWHLDHPDDDDAEDEATG